MALTLDNRGPPLSSEELAAVERRLGIDLPDDYRAFLLEQNGGAPYPSQFLGEGGHPLRITRFLSVGLAGPGPPDPNDFEATVAFHRDELELPPHLVPIGLVDYEDFLLLSVAGEDRGTVYYWYLIESGFDGSHFGKAFNSFPELLASLKDYNPEWVRKIETGDIEGVRGWLDAGGDVNASGDNDWRPLDYARMYKQAEIAKLLRARGGRRGVFRSVRSVVECALVVLMIPVLFVILVIVAPIVLVIRWGAATFGGYLGKLAVCAAGGLFVWMAAFVVFQLVYARFSERNDRDHTA
jgi:hypothetical protein